MNKDDSDEEGASEFIGCLSPSSSLTSLTTCDKSQEDAYQSSNDHDMFNGIEEVIVCLKIKQSCNTRQWVSETTETGDSFEGSLSDSETSESQPEVEVLPEHRIRLWVSYPQPRYPQGSPFYKSCQERTFLRSLLGPISLPQVQVKPEELYQNYFWDSQDLEEEDFKSEVLFEEGFYSSLGMASSRINNENLTTYTRNNFVTLISVHYNPPLVTSNQSHFQHEEVELHDDSASSNPSIYGKSTDNRKKIESGQLTDEVDPDKSSLNYFTAEFSSRGSYLSSQKGLDYDRNGRLSGQGSRQDKWDKRDFTGHPEPTRETSVTGLKAPRSKDSGIENLANAEKKIDLCIFLMSSIAIRMEVEEGASVTSADLMRCLVNEGDISLPRQISSEVFALWMSSPLLEVQLEPQHKPFYIRRDWNRYLQRFSSTPPEKKVMDEPILSIKRNIFLSKRDEVKLRDPRVLELLYEEAKHNILTGRYPCEISDYLMLGGIQARLELGPYDANIHTPPQIRTVLFRFLPKHIIMKYNLSSCNLWRVGAAKSSLESQLIDQLKGIPRNGSTKQLVQKYLECCWSLPYYGSAFFHGQVETPTRSLTSLFVNPDTEVLIAINPQGLFCIDPINVVILLGLKLEDLSWNYTSSSQENEDSLPCLYIQFHVIENEHRVSKILQIFSRQAVQMDTLIERFVENLKNRMALYKEDPDGNLFNDSASTDADDCLVPLTTVSRTNIPDSCLSNKLNRLTLATLDDKGNCVAHKGSWSLSK